MTRKTFSPTFQKHAHKSVNIETREFGALSIVLHQKPLTWNGSVPLRILLGSTALAPLFSPFLRLGLASLFAMLSACGTNVSASRAPRSDVETAQKQMEASSYSDAQLTLERILAVTPDDYASRSLLAASHAAQGGVILLDVILSALSASTDESSQTQGSDSGSEIDSILSLLPSPTAANIAQMVTANAEMAKIPATSLTASMKTQGSIFLLFESFLRIARLRENPSLLATLSVTEAKAIVLSLNRSAALAATAGGGTNPFAEVTSQVAEELEQTPGADERAKLTVYVARISQ